jgi:hypothetical protein
MVLRHDILALRTLGFGVFSGSRYPSLNTAKKIRNYISLTTFSAAALALEMLLYLRPKRCPHFMDTIRCDPELAQFSKQMGHWHIDSSSEELSCVERSLFLLIFR